MPRLAVEPADHRLAGGDAKALDRDRGAEREGAGAHPLAAGAVAGHGQERRRAHLDRHPPAAAASRQRQIRFRHPSLPQPSRSAPSPPRRRRRRGARSSRTGRSSRRRARAAPRRPPPPRRGRRRRRRRACPRRRAASRPSVAAKSSRRLADQVGLGDAREERPQRRDAALLRPPAGDPADALEARQRLLGGVDVRRLRVVDDLHALPRRDELAAVREAGIARERGLDLARADPEAAGRGVGGAGVLVVVGARQRRHRRAGRSRRPAGRGATRRGSPCGHGPASRRPRPCASPRR